MGVSDTRINFDLIFQVSLMKLAQLLVALFAVNTISAIYIDGVNYGGHITEPPIPTATEAVVLEKRIHKEYIDKQKENIEKAEAAFHGSMTSTADTPKPWLRTIYGSIKEVVKPTVIAGVTFSAKPPATTNGLEPWISLNKNGSPKTIKPQLKNGHTKNPSPSYSTWFSTPTTVVYTKEELKAHNMADDEVFEDVEWIEEDRTYRDLNPIIRCTPELYFKKGVTKQASSEPFCFPHDNSRLKLGNQYFVTWYSRFFEDAAKVRFHISGIRPSLKDNGLKKRSSVMDRGGKITSASFYTSDWVENAEGLWVLDVVEEFFSSESQMDRKVLLSIQPDTVDDSEFDLLKNSLVLEFFRPGGVYKGHNEDLDVLERKQKLSHLNIELDEGLDYEKYFVIFSIPLFVVVLFFAMLLFVKANKVDLSHLKHRKPLGKNTKHRRIPFKRSKNGYSELPQHTNDIPLKDLNKTE